MEYRIANFHQQDPRGTIIPVPVGTLDPGVTFLLQVTRNPSLPDGIAPMDDNDYLYSLVLSDFANEDTPPAISRGIRDVIDILTELADGMDSGEGTMQYIEGTEPGE